MAKTIITTNEAPAPIGPYNQAVLSGSTLFISGQICIDPATGELRNEDVEEETEQVMKNLKAILDAAKMNFSDVVKTTIFLTNMNEFAVVNSIYGKYFDKEFPARETVAVVALPKFVKVEISMIAIKS
jgi:2-iminobutanoate/2-iminopropanoate deaminase